MNKMNHVFLDRRTLSIIRYIKRHPQTTEKTIRFKKKINLCDVDPILKALLSEQIISKSKTVLEQQSESNISISSFLSETDPLYITWKGRELLDDRFDRVWMWAIPTIISVAALIVSIIF